MKYKKVQGVYNTNQEIRNKNLTINYYNGANDYTKYLSDVYGREVTYLGYLSELMGVREKAERLGFDITHDSDGKNFTDYINQILQFSDIKYAMERDSVGVVRNIDVSKAVKGLVTTNINNYGGKETKMGYISNLMYGNTLLYGAQYNSLRRTKYITPELETVYGNNLSNVYNLSTLFRVNNDTGRIGEPDSGEYIKVLPTTVKEYLYEINPELKLPSNVKDLGYSDENKYGVTKHVDEEIDEYIVKDKNVSTITSNSYTEAKVTRSVDTFSVYSEMKTVLKDNEVSGGISVQAISDNASGLLKKTKEYFDNRRINTMVSRFHDTKQEKSLTQSAVYHNFGISHGRNLLNKDAWENGSMGIPINGYTNPYCRTWTSYHQYSKMKHLIRPFTIDGEFKSIEELQNNWTPFRAEDGAKRLSDYGVLNKNGMVNITPTRDGEVDIKKCMFSIENLAWKDVLVDEVGGFKKTGNDVTEQYEKVGSTLSNEQKGPNGGRIMWFPPYDITFNESSTAEWNETNFIGRGENIYTYVNTKRSGNLSFTMLVDHPAVIDYWMLNKKNNASEDNEQEALRFFAGCSELDINEEIINNIHNGAYEGGTVDPQEIEEGTDITFYTFFPNNYSGVEDENNALEKLFGGLGNLENGEVVISDRITVKDSMGNTSGDTYFLGYEMGVNPMSLVDVTYTTLATNEYYLDSVYSYSIAEKKFGNLSEIEVGSEITLEDIKTCYMASYNHFVWLKKRYENKNKDIDKYVEGIDKEIQNLNEVNEEVSNNNVAKVAVNSLISNKESEKEINEKKKEENTQSIDYYNDAILQVESKLKPENGIKKTNAFFIYRDRSDKVSEYDSALKAYATYSVDNAKIYDEDKIYLFLKQKQEVVCKDKNGQYYISLFKNGNEFSFITFKNKRAFAKSGFLFGKDEKGTYYANINGDIKVFEEYNDFKDFRTNEGKNLIPKFDNPEMFKESSSLFGQNVTTNELYSYIYTTASKDTAVSSILSNYSDLTDEEVIKLYYDNHKYTCFNDIKLNDFGVIQFFYTSKLQSGGTYYESIQDFIASCDINNDETYKIMSEAYGVIKNENGNNSIKAHGKIDRNDANPINGKKCYYYPVDKGKDTENLQEIANYMDLYSFGLNSTLEFVREAMGDDSITFSFGEVYAALKGDEKYKEYVKMCERAVLSQRMGYKDAELETKMKEVDSRISYLESVLNAKESKKDFKVTKMESYGSASGDGSSDKNIELSNNRCSTIIKALKEFPSLKNVESSSNKDTKSGEKKGDNNVSSISAKSERHAKISIVINDKDNNTSEELNNNSNTEKNDNSKVLIKNNRYDDEYRFFEMLRENDNIAYKRLVDKVKYFSPAYHSLSPEGFNARLTFLHQCTRQGPTMTVSDISTGSTAANLAFGRAPFCILRLGDFLNTKIVIRSVSISYPDTMWDLNPEGIGVQFMMAKVDLGIDIIGGSDISAPINRLQNAVSFNYYANTSIYDNRSDRALYNKASKKIDDVYTWHPTILTNKTSIDTPK